MIAFTIDELTPCLIDTLTGETIQTEVVEFHILWACTAPHNNVWENGEQKYKGVGGHLFAIASEISVMSGFDGTVYGEAMDEEILRYYVKQFGANRLPRTIHPYAMAINSATAKRIREVYDYDWSDEVI